MKENRDKITAYHIVKEILLEHKDLEYTLAELADIAGYQQSTVSSVLSRLKKKHKIRKHWYSRSDGIESVIPKNSKGVFVYYML